MAAPTQAPSTPDVSGGKAAKLQPPASERANAPFFVVTVSDPGQLATYLACWDDLAAAAVEPNVFYESWMLLPALRAYAGGTVTVVLVFSNRAPHKHGKPLLCGLFPLEKRGRGFLRVFALWSYLHC